MEKERRGYFRVYAVGITEAKIGSIDMVLFSKYRVVPKLHDCALIDFSASGCRVITNHPLDKQVVFIFDLGNKKDERIGYITRRVKIHDELYEIAVYFKKSSAEEQQSFQMSNSFQRKVKENQFFERYQTPISKKNWYEYLKHKTGLSKTTDTPSV